MAYGEIYKEAEKKAKAVAKTKPAITKEQMIKAVDFVKGGGDVKAIKNKYKLTPEQEKQLVK